MTLPPPRYTLFPYRRSSDLAGGHPAASGAAQEEDLAQGRDRAQGRPSGEPLQDGETLCARHRRRKISCPAPGGAHSDRKSTRLNSSHTVISYAVFCLKKKKQ